eukprot:TRINITY_DN75103_c0_g1_i1.p1 TRINITY_DN75103_c0_g1~~TRINITY_DN75103_c0_g1_i1.p1  ORF type:complete len:421 (+),score=34.08 TRINITY_DN75103_c0_g1_i1:131-1393(+)
MSGALLRKPQELVEPGSPCSVQTGHAAADVESCTSRRATVASDDLMEDFCRRTPETTHKMIVKILRFTDMVGWTKPHDAESLRWSQFAFYISAALQLTTILLLCVSVAIMAKRAREDQHAAPTQTLLAVMDPTIVLLFYSAIFFIHLGAYGICFEGLGPIMQSVPHVPCWVSVVVVSSLGVVNSIFCLQSFFKSGVTAQLGPVFDNPIAFGLWVISRLWICNAVLAVILLLMSIPKLLMQDLIGLEQALQSGCAMSVRQAHSRFVGHLRFTRGPYRAASTPIVVFCVIACAAGVSHELDLWTLKHTTRNWIVTVMTAVSFMLMLWTVTPATRIPVKYGRLKAAVAVKATYDGQREILDLLIAMHAVQDQAGLWVAGFLITNRFLITCVSYGSVVMSVLRRLDGDGNGTDINGNVPGPMFE